MARRKRIAKELSDLTQNPLDLCDVSESESFEKWHVLITGPKESCYSNGLFKLSIDFNKDYPIKPPKVTMMTQIFHLNINDKGRICLDKLTDKWDKEHNKIKDILEDLLDILENPSPDEAINDDALAIYLDNLDLYKKTAIEWTKQFANNNKDKDKEKQEEKKDD